MFQIILKHIIVYVSELILEGGETSTITSHNYPYNVPDNAYNYWNILAPKGYAVLISFRDLDTDSKWDVFTYICFGNNTTAFQKDLDFCSPWTCLTLENIHEASIFEKFVSRNSSMKIIFSTFLPFSGFSLSVRTIKIYGR